VFCTATPARGAPDRGSKALRPARTDAREHEQVAERVPVFAEAQMLARSTANPMEMRVSVPAPSTFLQPPVALLRLEIARSLGLAVLAFLARCGGAGVLIVRRCSALISS
jgi:hypothetical protein